MRDPPRHIALAAELGFPAAWCYDPPLRYHEALTPLAALADGGARRTVRILRPVDERRRRTVEPATDGVTEPAAPGGDVSDGRRLLLG